MKAGELVRTSALCEKLRKLYVESGFKAMNEAPS